MPTILLFAAAYHRPPQRKWFVSCLDVLDKGRDGLLQVTATTRREPASQCETEPNARTAFLASALTRSSNSRLDRGRPTRQTAEPHRGVVHPDFFLVSGKRFVKLATVIKITD